MFLILFKNFFSVIFGIALICEVAVDTCQIFYLILSVIKMEGYQKNVK